MDKIIQTAYKCKVCSEFVVGVYHEMVSCKCNKVDIDVGTMYTRIHGDHQYAKDNWEHYILDENSTVEEYRDKLLWGSYGIDELGNSLLDIWAEKQPQVAKDYQRNKFLGGPRIDQVLNEEEYKEYNNWMDEYPKKEYLLMKDMDSNHIVQILKGQLHISAIIKEAFKLEIRNRGIDASHI